jgi:hypothetical protein
VGVMGWGGLIRTEAVAEIPLRFRFISSLVLLSIPPTMPACQLPLLEV